MEQNRTYMNELKALFHTPRTLRSMKYTNWSKTTTHEGEGYKKHLKIIGEHEQTAIYELGKAVSGGGVMSEELLAKFVFSEMNELVYNAEEEVRYKPKPSWCNVEVWNAEWEKRRSNQDKELIEWNRVFTLIMEGIYNKKNCEKTLPTIKNMSWGVSQDDNAKKREAKTLNVEKRIAELDTAIKSGIEKYDALQVKMVERYGITSVPFEEREKTDTIQHTDTSGDYNYTKLCGKTEFVNYIKAFGKKRSVLTADQDSVIELKYVIKDNEGGRQLYYWENLPLNEVKENGKPFSIIHIRNMASCENVFLKKGALLADITRADEQTLFVPKMFKVISKNEKLYTEGLKGEKDRKTTIQNAFEPYEESGIEIMYVRLGYKSDGTKNGNRNRGNLECLKDTYKQNRCGEIWDEKKLKWIKDKTKKMPTKKDDLVRILYKL